MNEQKELVIQIPDGMEIDKEHSTFEKIMFKKKENKHSMRWPINWNELNNINGYYIDGDSDIQSASNCSASSLNKNIWPTQDQAEASLALSQLMQLRQRWVDGWEPDWMDDDDKYILYFYCDGICIDNFTHVKRPLSFPTKKMAISFMDVFKDLLETAKPLL